MANRLPEHPVLIVIIFTTKALIGHGFAGLG
jgi:hypothetical protein